ncbi:MAG: flagellar hook basal-body protein [Candidatus Eisenbacteria bacterium]|nr:flagellar hook basal-body protein [Candidatus Eisenbacteria bacterium]
MADGIQLAGASMIRQQVRQDMLASNLANLSTPGFKATRVFQDVLSDVDAGAARNAEGAQRVYIDFSQGTIRPTGADLDMALEGEGFFTVLTPNGERYTRDGGFGLSGDGTLVDRSEYPVLGESGPIVLDGARTIEVDESGEIFAGGESIGRLEIKNFTNTEELRHEGAGLFAPRPGARLQETEPDVRVHQRCLEDSNVNTIDETIRMTTLLRGYEASQRMLQLQNEALGRVVNELVQG